jgi:Glycine zipper 2TM domain
MEAYEFLFPTIDFSRVKFYDGVPFYLNAGENGITVASVGLSSDIKIYLKEGVYNPCDSFSFITIAHELVHVLQIQESLLGGRIPGWWLFKYLACWLGWTYNGYGCDNKWEAEAYGFAEGCGSEKGTLLKCLEDSGIDKLAPCDCSGLPWYTPQIIPGTNETFVDRLKASCSKVVKQESNVEGSWKCYLSPGFILGLIVGLLSIFGLTNTGGAIGTVVGAIVGGIIGGLIGGPLGALIGAFVGAIVGGLVGSLIGGFIGLFSSNKGWIWQTMRDGTNWLIPDVPVTQNDHTKTSEGPALAAFNNKFFMTYKGSGSNDLWYNVLDAATGWLAQDIKITHSGHTKTSAAPSLAVYNGMLYMAYKASSGSNLWYNVFDGTNWLANDIRITQNGHTQSNRGPALAAYNGKLYIAYKGKDSDNLWYNVFDGSNWLPNDIKITKNGHTQSNDSPALAVYNGKLYMAYKGKGSDNLWYNVFDGTSWLSNDIRITQSGHTRSDLGPTLAVYNGKLYMVYKGSGSSDLWYNFFDGSNWLAQDIRISKYGSVKTSRSPAAAEFAGLLMIVYRAAS